MKPVESSNLQSLGYDPDNSELWVQFTSGEIYVYVDVPDYIANEAFDAPSKGSFLNRVVKPTYHFRRP